MQNPDSLRQDLALFADVGTEIRVFDDDKNHTRLSLYRNGDRIDLEYTKKSGIFSEKAPGASPRRHATYRALLASERFANLRLWANTQHTLLSQSIIEKDLIPVSGSLDRDGQSAGTFGIDELDRFLIQPRGIDHRLTTLLIDGPAGVGKTILISQLALRRARDFLTDQHPLILHVQSKGRVLSFLQDLIAFSLQVMRTNVTFDQVPVLARNGLVQIAIDGFDELGDPSGYDLAWTQLALTIEDLQPNGALILAGRETFIGRERLLKALPRLGLPGHNVGVLSLRPVSPDTARRWLYKTGWNERRIQWAEHEGLFEEGSYALRPFFLHTLTTVMPEADGEDHPKGISAKPPLLLLTEAMIEREATKFGNAVDKVLSLDKRIDFVGTMMVEIARDMAENETDAIDEELLRWLVEIAVGDSVDSTILRLLMNRAAFLGFLTNDERRGHRRFAHSEFQNLFLARGAFDAVHKEELPKYLRRSVLGGDFLQIFALQASAYSADDIDKFMKIGLDLLNRASMLDRSGRNLGALLLAALPSIALPESVSIVGVQVDEAVIFGQARPARIQDSTINQLDVRGADLTELQFANVQIASIIADSTTRVPISFPDVGFIELAEANGGKTLQSGDRAKEWLDQHGRAQLKSKEESDLREIREHPLYILLERISRVMLRHYWIRVGGEDRSGRLLDDSYWPQLKYLLDRCGLLTEDDQRSAGGRSATFIHVRHAHEILSANRDWPEVASLLDTIHGVIRTDRASSAAARSAQF